MEAREIDSIGVEGVIRKLRDRVGTERPVYLSIDIDTLDPACKSFPPPSITSFSAPPFPFSPAPACS